jgi:hypothetical protein
MSKLTTEELREYLKEKIGQCCIVTENTKYSNEYRLPYSLKLTAYKEILSLLQEAKNFELQNKEYPTSVMIDDLASAKKYLDEIGGYKHSDSIHNILNYFKSL